MVINTYHEPIFYEVKGMVLTVHYLGCDSVVQL